MGMSASQARFLSLTARKNNVEFEGQQINQQRTTLSNESASYYSDLCNMQVPVPPSVDDYTKVSYTFTDGAMTNTILSLLPKGNNQYSISYLKQWQDDYSIVSTASSLVSNANGIYSIGSSKLRVLGKLPESEEDYDEYLKSLTPEQITDLLEQEKYYVAMLKEEFGTDKWFVRYLKNATTGAYVPNFYREDELEDNNRYTSDTKLASINCYTIGSTTRTEEVLNQAGTVEKDASGRYVSITFINDDGTEVVHPLITTTVTDEEAYNNAMNQYNYAQHEYDHKIQEINSKLEIIQQQDKTLELKLKQLDTEENAISVEMDAVKKVISKNVESSFKTFNA